MRIQNQDHGTVTHDGGSGNALEIAQIRAQRLDDDFLAFQELIHHQTQAALIVVNDHHGQHVR